MLCYRDRTYCNFSCNCKHESTCNRALTADVLAAAKKWWGSNDAPICMYVDKPKCFEEKED